MREDRQDPASVMVLMKSHWEVRKLGSERVCWELKCVPYTHVLDPNSQSDCFWRHGI